MYCSICVVSSEAFLYILVTGMVFMMKYIAVTDIHNILVVIMLNYKCFHLIQLQLSIIRHNGNAFCVKNAIH